MNRDQAEKIVRAILVDLDGRHAFDAFWDGIDEEDSEQAAIRSALADIVQLHGMAPAPPVVRIVPTGLGEIELQVDGRLIETIAAKRHVLELDRAKQAAYAVAKALGAEVRT